MEPVAPMLMDAVPVTAPLDVSSPAHSAPAAGGDAHAAQPAPGDAALVDDAHADTVDTTAGVQPVVAVEGPFSSLYDTLGGTLFAISFGLGVVVIVQVLVNRIFSRARTMIEALTFFATSMVACLIAVYLCDLLIAGPDVLLLREGERSSIVSFVQDICLMVFAYFFGTKSNSDANNSPLSE